MKQLSDPYETMSEPCETIERAIREFGAEASGGIAKFMAALEEVLKGYFAWLVVSVHDEMVLGAKFMAALEEVCDGSCA